MADPKIYTRDEIKEFDLATCERFAKSLDWESYETRRYKTKSYPNYFGNSIITSRLQFLRLRLRLAKQPTWNLEAKEALAKQAAQERAKKLAEKKRKDEEEAKKPKVTVKVKTEIEIELRDHRKDGHRFGISQKGGKIVANQLSLRPGLSRYSVVGTTNCGARAEFSAEDFENAIEMIADLEMPKIESKKIGKASLQVNASVQLVGSHTINFYRSAERDIIGIVQGGAHTRGLVGLHKDDWQFRVSDLREVIAATKRRYEVVEKKKEEESSKPQEVATIK